MWAHGSAVSLFMLCALYIAGANCPGCTDCDYCYLKYPSNISANCNPYQSTFKLYCTVAGPSSSLFSIVWQIDGVDTPSSTSSYTITSTSGPVSGMNTSVDLRTSTLSAAMIPDGMQHNYSCTVNARGTGTFSLPASKILQVYPAQLSSASTRTSCSDNSFSVNDTLCASNQSLACSPPSTYVNPSLPSSRPTGPIISPTTVPNSYTNVSSSGNSNNVDKTTVVLNYNAITVYSTILPESRLQLQPTVTVNVTNDVNATGSTNSSLTRLWLYVVAGIATVFALTIVILCGLCVALCLKRSQTADTDTLKSQEPTQSIRMRFSSTGSSLYSSDQPNDPTSSGTTTAGDLDRDYDVITALPTALPTTQQYSRLHRPSLSPSPPQPEAPNSRQHSVCTTTTALTDFGSFRGNGESFEMTEIKGPNGHQSDPHEALYCVTTLSRLQPQTSQLWQQDQTLPAPAPASSATLTSNAIYHVLESAASDRGGAMVVVESAATPAGGVVETAVVTRDTLTPQPFPVCGYEQVPFPLVPYETPIPSCNGTGLRWAGNQTYLSEYSLPPDAVATVNSSTCTSHFADYSEPNESGNLEDMAALRTMTSVPDVPTTRNYEVLSATTMDPKSCYTRLKLGKHTVV